ncbi:hypothetical protein HQ945_08425 [Phyllobacterium sp. BT25]|uniref:Phage abortive infection protein n=1 Tax=Phyllobacterium pellucidum TaxID=2740464 RepID=A0A849VRI2_9HYPH|nr:putative phage abortive infection protein [Phyllobacterium pellucidum]NTS31279.1 hypothetical protein [Phyllobacterium pellucidum]
MLKIVVFTASFAVFVVCFWFYWAFYSDDLAYRAVGHINALNQAGTWGDSFGGFNALLGALGFTGVLATLLLQGQALLVQQKDLHKQRFEQTFFELLRMIREAREQIRFRHSRTYQGLFPKEDGSTLSGNHAFRAAYKELSYWVYLANKNGTEINKDTLGKFYAEHVHSRYESTLGAYYRLIYGALDRVRNDSYLSEKEKDDLGNLIRSQFTSFEALIAGCNALNDFAKDFDTIVVRFRLLKYARRGEVYDALRKLYPREAFLGRDEVDVAPDADTRDDDDLAD